MVNMKMLFFKFQQNRTITEEFNFFEEMGRGRGPREARGLQEVKGPLFINLISITVSKHMKMFRFSNFRKIVE